MAEFVGGPGASSRSSRTRRAPFPANATWEEMESLIGRESNMGPNGLLIMRGGRRADDGPPPGADAWKRWGSKLRTLGGPRRAGCRPSTDTGTEREERGPKALVAEALLSPGLFIPGFYRLGTADHLGRPDYLIVFPTAGKTSGARGVITAFARTLVSEPCRPLGTRTAVPRHVGLGCRLPVSGGSGNSPDSRLLLTQQRAWKRTSWPSDRVPKLGAGPRECQAGFSATTTSRLMTSSMGT
jgi:hypothetical protein